jgi:hypothetical protein
VGEGGRRRDREEERGINRWIEREREREREREKKERGYQPCSTLVLTLIVLLQTHVPLKYVFFFDGSSRPAMSFQIELTDDMVKPIYKKFCQEMIDETELALKLVSIHVTFVEGVVVNPFMMPFSS